MVKISQLFDSSLIVHLDLITFQSQVLMISCRASPFV